MKKLSYLLPSLLLLSACNEVDTDLDFCEINRDTAFSISIIDATNSTNLLCDAFITLLTPTGEIVEHRLTDPGYECSDNSESILLDGTSGLYDVRIEVAGYDEWYMQDVEVGQRAGCNSQPEIVVLTAEMTPR